MKLLKRISREIPHENPKRINEGILVERSEGFLEGILEGILDGSPEKVPERIPEGTLGKETRNNSTKKSKAIPPGIPKKMLE